MCVTWEAGRLMHRPPETGILAKHVTEARPLLAWKPLSLF
jgi:hypothetical protein